MKLCRIRICFENDRGECPYFACRYNLSDEDCRPIIKVSAKPIRAKVTHNTQSTAQG